MRNQKTDSETEREREIDDNEGDFENHDTSEKGEYRKTTTSPEDGMNLTFMRKVYLLPVRKQKTK